MPSATFNFFDQYRADVHNKVHNLGGDVLKIMLTNAAPVATNTIKANLTEIASGNGYTAGGATVAIASSTQTSGTWKLIPTADIVFTAAGGSIGPFRYVVIYNSTPTSPASPLIGYYDYGSSITLNDGETFTVDLDQTNGILHSP